MPPVFKGGTQLMDNPEFDQYLQDRADHVRQSLHTRDLLSIFPDCSEFLNERLKKLPAWQVALPTITCLAAGGTLESGTLMALSWNAGYLASEILDNVEDREFIPDRWVPSPEVATNLATSLIFFAFHTLTYIPGLENTLRAARIFARSGFEASSGQHRDLIKTPSTVDKSLNDYWEMIILKSGSIFRTAAAGGAAAGTSNDRVIEALGDYGTALGVMLQLIDDCRDVFTCSQENVRWEVSLPLLLYLMSSGEDDIRFPQAASKAEWSEMLGQVGAINTIASLLLEWKNRALQSLQALNASKEKQILASIPSLFLERLPVETNEVVDGKPS